MLGPARPRWCRRPRGCDPRRPRRAGAGWLVMVAIAPPTSALRSSPAPEGRCWAPHDHGGAGARGVAILAGPGGPVLVTWLSYRDRRAGQVAILAGPGGPVLVPLAPVPTSATFRGCDPRRPRRAGAGGAETRRLPGGRPGCDPRRPRRAGAGRCPPRLMPLPASGCDPRRPRRAGAGGPPRGEPSGRPCAGCDPRRPRRAGAGTLGLALALGALELRSSPAPEGRCWPGPRCR